MAAGPQRQAGRAGQVGYDRLRDSPVHDAPPAVARDKLTMARIEEGLG
jgi:hypothetical protein